MLDWRRITKNREEFMAALSNRGLSEEVSKKTLPGSVFGDMVLIKG